MARGAQIESLWNGLRDNSGQALSGGKVFTYIAGTSTPAAVYTNSALTTPAANPVILDSNGKALVFANGAYKFVIKTSADVTIATLDNLYYYEVDTFGVWAPSYSASGTLVWTPTPATVLATYTLIDKLCFFALQFSGNIASGAGSLFTATLPFISAATGGNFWATGIVASGGVNSISVAQISSNSNILAIYKSDIGATNLTTGTGGAHISGFYKIA